MILWFSGTGNSRWVAEELANKLGDRALPLLEGKKALTPGEALGWVFPTHSWGPPPVVVDWVRSHDIDGWNEDTYCYMVTTCGDDIGQCVQLWREALGPRQCQAAFSVQMPNSYVCLPGFDVDSSEVEAAKLAAAPARIDAVAQAIAVRQATCNVVTGRLTWLKSRVVRPWFAKHGVDDSRFVVDENTCTHCGVCVRSCPMHNITLDDRQMPRWHGNCAMCLGCLHRCPARAIDHGKATRNKGRYHHP